MTPALFIGHGSPMNAIEKNQFTEKWKQIADSFPNPSSILVISAHWQTIESLISASQKPETIHDFGRFPEKLTNFQYPVSGNPELAESIANKLQIDTEPNMGLDHGAWSVLCQMYPNANIPCFQLSLDLSKTEKEHFEFAQKLAYLRGENVLILGTGNIVHNLGAINWQGGDTVYPWVKEFNDNIVQNIQKRNFEKVVNYKQYGSMAKNSVPTPEHFWPLLYVLGASRQDDSIETFNNQAVMGSLTMTSVIVG